MGAMGRGPRLGRGGWLEKEQGGRAVESDATGRQRCHTASGALLRKPGSNPPRERLSLESPTPFLISGSDPDRQTDKAVLRAWQPLRTGGEANLLVT